MKEKTEKKKTAQNKISKYRDFSTCGKNSFLVTVSASSHNFKCVLVDGVKKIKKYTEELVVLQSELEDISFCGREIKCLTYASGAIEISGEIKSISFDTEK